MISIRRLFCFVALIGLVGAGAQAAGVRTEKDVAYIENGDAAQKLDLYLPDPAPEKPLPVAPFSLIFRRRSFSGSLIGGLPETQEMLDFCAQHGIASDIEMIRMDQINEAYDRMLKSDVKYRFVIDMASLK